MAAFVLFHKYIQIQFSANHKAVQSDGGGEYFPFTKHLAGLGIVHGFICPYTSHLNGIVERKHRHLTEMALTLLSHASLPMTYWDHAITNATHLINRLPTTGMSPPISPFQALYHTVPNFKQLKTFGCACYPHLRPYNKAKFQFHSSQCMNLGISPSHKGFKCLTPYGKIIISKDVTFDELTFPYPSIFASPSSSHTSSDISASLPIPSYSLPPNSASQSTQITPPTNTSPTIPATISPSSPTPAASPSPLTTQQ